MKNSAEARARFHYGWVIVAAGVLVLFACLGLARFSFGILLPSMAEALDLSYAERGYVGTGYFVGYLGMVALAPALARRMGNRAAIGAGLALIAATMILLGSTDSYVAVLVCYTVTGMGSGAANIPIMALVSHWFAPSLRGMATGLMLAGNGTGIVVSGILVPHVVAHFAGGWRAGWWVLGAIAAVVCIASTLLLRNDPSDMGLDMLGEGPKPAVGAKPAKASKITREERRSLVHIGLTYLAFGFTYIIYGTFIVTTLIDEHGFGEDTAGQFWAWVGVFSLFSGAIFGRISDRAGRRKGMAITYGVQTCAYLLAGFAQTTWPLYLSVALYGLSAWAVPTIMSATVADRLGPARAASGFAFITLFFSAGQVLGPTMAGWIADATGSFSASYLLSAAMTAAAIVSALRITPARKA